MSALAISVALNIAQAIVLGVIVSVVRSSSRALEAVIEGPPAPSFPWYRRVWTWVKSTAKSFRKRGDSPLIRSQN